MDDTITAMAKDCGWTVTLQDDQEYHLTCPGSGSGECVVSPIDESRVSLSVSSPLVKKLLISQYPDLLWDSVSVRYELPKVLRSAFFLTKKLSDSPVQQYQAEAKLKSEQAPRVDASVEKVGLDIHTKNMFLFWDNRCALTGLALKPMLCSVYAKPWERCINDMERLDVANGLLLEARYARLFETGYIAFDAQGKMLVSSLLSESDLAILSIDRKLQLRKVKRNQQKYLLWQKNNLFQP